MSSAEHSVHLVGGNRLSARREFCGVHSWQNGKRCRDGVKLLWCLVGFRGFHPYMRLFSFRKLFCDFFCYRYDDNKRY